MKNSPSEVKKYITVFGWLAIFTVIEIAAAGFPGLARGAVTAVILATALGKALLIAIYFMHLKSENRLVWLLPGIPLFFILLFIFGLVPDISWHLTGNF